jgi:hypothetical protein
VGKFFGIFKLGKDHIRIPKISKRGLKFLRITPQRHVFIPGRQMPPLTPFRSPQQGKSQEGDEDRTAFTVVNQSTTGYVAL